VEIERARLIKRLAKIKEEQGKIDEAADLMQEVAVSLHALEFRITGSYIIMMMFSFFWCSFPITFHNVSTNNLILRLKHLAQWLRQRKLHSFWSRYVDWP
jgi:hypothetical protein